IIGRALAKNRVERYPSAAAFGAAIAAWLEQRAMTGAENVRLSVTRAASAAEELSGSAVEARMPRTGETVLDRFAIARVVGCGGMGVVYAARHVGLDERVALKVMSSIGDPVLVTRFVNEAKLAARVRSPHVCKVVDVGALPSGMPYLAM